MSSNTENTEAKLAAYIDGLLDDAQRAQLEQYLQANPEHRKLLADLIAQRADLRSLPRDKAPADIYDSLQAQLERSILLDDSAESGPVVIRHSRRSQLFAIAAILLLAIGLCGVLYFALPSFSRRPIEVAGRPADLPTTLATIEPETDRKPSEPETEMQDQPGTAIAETPETPATLPAVETQIAEIAPQHPNQLVVLVSSADPSKARQQVAGYLESNNIRWETLHDVPANLESFGRMRAMRASVSSTTLQSPSPRNLILARGMTRRQATELTDTLSSETATQHARLILDASTRAKIAKTKFESQDLNLTLGQAVYPASPTTAPTADALAVTSTPPPPASAAPAAEARALGTVESAKTNEPDTAPSPTTQLTISAGLPASLATTVPSPATQPDETNVDVVILVEDQPFPAATTAPTTQESPASQPASTQPAE